MQDPAVKAIEDEGFEALDDWTGVPDELGPLWPAADSVGVPRQELGWHEDPTMWFVRSPWPSISLADLFDRMLWNWVERTDCDPTDRLARIVEVLHWPEDEALAWLQQNPPEEPIPEPEAPSAALADELGGVLDAHSVQIQQQLTELGGKPRPGMFVVVPYRFERVVKDLTYLGMSLITDLVDLPQVRAYRPIS